MPGLASRCLGKLPPEHAPGRPQPNLPVCKELVTSHNRQLDPLGSTLPSTVLGGKSHHGFFQYSAKGSMS